ncbi:MAG: hypothetical protein IJR82_02615 [Bacilli bacterium]|nr:hypothetical protein [Bacilli bacterium]
MVKIIENDYADDIAQIKYFLSSRPDTLGIYCYEIACSFTKKVYHLIIVCDDIWQWQLYNQQEFNNYINALHDMNYKFIDFLNIKCQNFLVDYTLIGQQNFIDFLENWSNFTIASKLHKPFLMIESNNNLDKAIDINHRMALLLSLLMCKKNEISFALLMEKIYGLSCYDNLYCLNAVERDYKSLEQIYNYDDYFTKTSSNKVLINTKNIQDDLTLLPFDILDDIEVCFYGLDFDNLYKHLQTKLFWEKDKMNDMRMLVNGIIKTFFCNHYKPIEKTLK